MLAQDFIDSGIVTYAFSNVVSAFLLSSVCD